jgi:hypothetical protein
LRQRNLILEATFTDPGRSAGCAAWFQQAIGYTEKAEAILQSLADGDPSNVFYWCNRD